MLRIFVSVFFLILPVAAGDRLMVCGAAEVFQIDVAAETPEKLWYWRAKDCAELPRKLIRTFRSTTDCKVINGGKRMLISASSGGCVLLELATGKALWWATVHNAHSIEALPGGLIAVAASSGEAGDKVVIFDEKVPLKPVSQVPLRSAHGLVWDDSRQVLWALGFNKLLACVVERNSLVVRNQYPLPDKGGHDLRGVPGSADLIISTHSGVRRFDRENATFSDDPELKDRVETKSVDVHPTTGRGAIVQASDGNWWTDTIELLNPAGKIQLKGEVVYKARWVADFATMPEPVE